MKQIRIKQLSLRNFKGTTLKTFEFNNPEPIFNNNNEEIGVLDQTTIQGDNGTGKTTVFDAFNWLLWGKNSANEATFELKTIGATGHIHNLEHEVSGIIDVDGLEMSLKRVYKEKWVTKRGSEIKEMNGHETFLFINDVPLSASEYKKAINDIINDEISRLITDTMYFNVFLTWQKRREILTKLAGEISDNDILELNPELDEISDILQSGKSLTMKKAEISAKKTTIQLELKQVPARLDEVDRNKPFKKDFEAIEETLVLMNKKKQSIELKISDVQSQINASFELKREAIENKNQLILKIEEEKNDCYQRAQSESNQARNNKITLEAQINQANSMKSGFSANLAGNNVSIESLRKSNADLKLQYEAKTAEQPNLSTDENCNSCGQKLPTDRIDSEIEKLTANFNTQKATELKRLSDLAIANNAEIQRLQAENSNIDLKIADCEKLISNLTLQLGAIVIPESIVVVDSELLISLRAKLAEIESTEETNDELSTESLKAELDSINAELDTKKLLLLDKTAIENAEKRISELKDSQRVMSQQIATLERTEMQIDKFIKLRMETVENRVNKLFSFAKFKMFETQINGGETPTCVCIVDNVPFSDLNTGKKINAGLDIVNTLQREFEVFAPVFIDNRESVTEIIPMDCQLINLVVVKGLQTLEVI